MQRSFLENAEPHQALCLHFNVRKGVLPTTATLPATFDMLVLRDAHMPTHVLALMQADGDPTVPPLMAPIDADLYNRGFRVEIIPPPPPGTAAPIPHSSSNPHYQVVTLPVVPVTVPHVSSVPLLLLFGLELEKQKNLMALKLLPSNVVEEFPNAAAMAQVMSHLSEDQFQRCFRYNQGMWQNVLSLGLRDTSLAGMIQTAWNVTAEARRIRHRNTKR